MTLFFSLSNMFFSIKIPKSSVSWLLFCCFAGFFNCLPVLVTTRSVEPSFGSLLHIFSTRTVSFALSSLPSMGTKPTENVALLFFHRSRRSGENGTCAECNSSVLIVVVVCCINTSNHSYSCTKTVVFGVQRKFGKSSNNF